MTTNATGRIKSATKSQHVTVNSHIKAMVNKKMPATFDNSSHCSPIQMLANNHIGDCVLATVLHLLKVQYSLIGKDFAIDENTLWGLYGTSSYDKAYALMKKILIWARPSEYNVNSNLTGRDGVALQEVCDYGKKYGLLGAKIAIRHDLDDSELYNIDLIKRLVYYYGCLPVSVGMTTYEGSKFDVNGGPPYNFEIPPGCPWSGRAVLDAFSSALKNLKLGYQYVDVHNQDTIKQHEKYEYINSPVEFWDAIFRSWPSSNHVNILNLSEIPSGRGGVKFEDAGVDGSTFGYFLYKANEIGTKWNKWANNSKEFVNGHEILITGWDSTGFKIVTWDGTGHMSYEYWYIHALDAQVVVSELWINALQNKDKKLLLNTLL